LKLLQLRNVSKTSLQGCSNVKMFA